MFTELLFVAPLGALCYFKWIRVWEFLLIIVTLYWLPRCIFIKNLKKIFPQILFSCKNKNRKIALTFDDVPNDPKTFLEIVRHLDHYNMKGTFFVISDYINALNNDQLVEIVKNGHQLCNHGATNSMHALKNKNALATEIEHCNQKINYIYQRAGITPSPKKYYRPGCGLFGPTMMNYTSENKYIITLGSVYPNDPVFCVPYWNYLYLKWHIKSGDIVILHDRKWTPSMLYYLLPWMKENDYTSVTLNDLVEQKRE